VSTKDVANENTEEACAARLLPYQFYTWNRRECKSACCSYKLQSPNERTKEMNKRTKELTDERNDKTKEMHKRTKELTNKRNETT
jgi:hypothetical protein